MTQFSGRICDWVDLKVAEHEVSAIPGVTKFTQVFPNAKDRLNRIIVVEGAASVLPLLQALPLWDYIQGVSPRTAPQQEGPHRQDDMAFNTGVNAALKAVSEVDIPKALQEMEEERAAVSEPESDAEGFPVPHPIPIKDVLIWAARKSLLEARRKRLGGPR